MLILTFISLRWDCYLNDENKDDDNERKGEEEEDEGMIMIMIKQICS